MKRAITIVLVALCLVSLVFAGGSSEGKSGETGKPTLKVLGPFLANFDPVTDPTTLAIEEKTGYHVEYSMLPQDGAEQRLNMELASGADYDILRLDPKFYTNLVGQNAFLPLDDLLAEYGQELLSVISPETWELGKYNGVTYGIPMMNERSNIENTIVMRKDILDDLGLDVPRTLDEFTETLRAVKAAYPDMIPLSAAPVTGGAESLYMETLISAFGFYFDWNEVDGKIIHRVELPAYKEYLSYLKSLFDEGLLDPEIAVNRKVNLDEKFASGTVFAMPTCWNDISIQVPALMANNPDAEVVYLTPIEDENGVARIRANRYLNTVTAIPRSSKHPEDAVKFMNAKVTEPTFTYITLGTEGETFTKDETGYHPIMPIFSELRNNAWWYLNGIREVEYADMWLARTRRVEALGNAFDAVNAEYDKYAAISPLADMPTLPSVSKYQTACNQLISDFEIQAVMGVKSLDEMDAFVTSWKDAGGQEMTEEINQWYAGQGK